MGFLQRIKKKIGTGGETFNIGSNTYRGIFKVLDTGTMRAYLDDVEAMGVARPGLLLIADADTPLTAGAAITRDGRTYEVLKVSIHRIAGAAAAKVALLA